MKAQFWSFDIIFALVIFGVTVTILTFVWFGINSQLALTSGFGFQNVQNGLQRLQTTLLSSGTPENWESMVNVSNTSTWSNITAGLQQAGAGQGTLNERKVLELMAMSNADYQATKPVLGVGYDYYITISGRNLYLAIGHNPSMYNATTVQVSSAIVTVDGEPATMQTIVWTNSTFGVS